MGKLIKLSTLIIGVVMAICFASCKTDTQTEYVDKTYAAAVTFTVTETATTGILSVTMATATQGADIYYTTDGSEPTAQSTNYTAAVLVSKDTTFKAIAIKEGIENSPVSTATISIKEKTVEVEVEKIVEVEKKVEVEKEVEVTVEKIVEVEKIVYSSAISETGTYTVYHLQQKKSGGKAFADYVVCKIENSKSVEKGATLDNLKKSYAGFTPKSLAQNETAIYVFYDRNTIEYTFTSGTEGKFYDETTSKVVRGLFGANYAKPISPISEDYYFVKWQDAEGTGVPRTFGAESKTFTADWKDKSAGEEVIPDGFVKVTGTTINGDEIWTPMSYVFLSGRSLTIPDLIVCDHEVTRGEYKTVVGTDPSTASAYDEDGNQSTGDDVSNNPVNYLNSYSAIVYCNKLSIAENLTPCYTISNSTDPDTWGTVPTSGNSIWNAATCDFKADGYRLPTEAEWEWFARGGENYTYAGSNTVDDVAWYSGSTNWTGTRDVKTKIANAYGLYNISGNVWEWCWDWDGSISSTTPASGPASGSRRVLRGGSWDFDDESSAVSYRWFNAPPDYRDDSFGFRVVRTSPF